MNIFYAPFLGLDLIFTTSELFSENCLNKRCKNIYLHMFCLSLSTRICKGIVYLIDKGAFEVRQN